MEAIGRPPALTGFSEAPSTATRRGVSSCSMDVASVNAHSCPGHGVFPFAQFARHEGGVLLLVHVTGVGAIVLEPRPRCGPLDPPPPPPPPPLAPGGRWGAVAAGAPRRVRAFGGGAGQMGRAVEADPGDGLVAGQALLGNGRNLGQQPPAPPRSPPHPPPTPPTPPF